MHTSALAVWALSMVVASVVRSASGSDARSVAGTVSAAVWLVKAVTSVAAGGVGCSLHTTGRSGLAQGRPPGASRSGDRASVGRCIAWPA